MPRTSEPTKIDELPAPLGGKTFDFEKEGLTTSDLAALLTAHMKGTTGGADKPMPATYIKGPAGVRGLVDEMTRAVEWLGTQKKQLARLTKLFELLRAGRLAIRFVDATPAGTHPANPRSMTMELYELPEGEPIT
jgi:hypothetical protein